jgi:hypothetical protein
MKAAAPRHHTASPSAIVALRKFCVSKGQAASMVQGRYIEYILLQMGGVVRSEDDVFVKNAQYNCWAQNVVGNRNPDQRHETELRAKPMYVCFATKS